jgi:phage gp36-like protein
MSSSCVLEGDLHRKVQAQYEQANNSVLQWLQENRTEWLYRGPDVSLSYCKTLSRRASQEKNLVMPEEVRQHLQEAVQLRRRCQSHHVELGNDDQDPCLHDRSA